MPKVVEKLLSFCEKDNKKIALMPAGSHAKDVLLNFFNPTWYKTRCVCR